MPENEPNLRYGEVIQETMDAIVRDELNNPTFTIDLLEQMTKVPAQSAKRKKPSCGLPATGLGPQPLLQIPNTTF